MAAWVIPALKAILPHVGTIVSAAAPVFTKIRTGSAPDPTALLQDQVAELQAAASRNASHVKDLAAQLQSTVAALEQGAAMAESRLRRAYLLCLTAGALSVLALGVALMALLGR